MIHSKKEIKEQIRSNCSVGVMGRGAVSRVELGLLGGLIEKVRLEEEKDLIEVRKLRKLVEDIPQERK